MRTEVNKVRLTVLIALLFSALCAGVFRTPPILFMAALLFSAPVVGVLAGVITSRGLRVERRIAEVGTVGDVISGEIIVRNEARWPVFLVQALSGTSASTDPSVMPLYTEDWAFPMLRSQERGVWRQQWVLQRRGVYTLSPARAGVLDPLGLYTRMPAVSAAHPMVVLPRPVKIEQIGFLGGAGASSRTPHHSTSVANAMDFHGVRPWQPGEAIRRAHWKNTARTGQLHVIEWEETPTADLAIFLDTQAETIGGEGNASTLEDAITTAASVAVHLLENSCRVQLFYYARVAGKEQDVALQRIQARSVEDIGTILRALAEVEPVDRVEVSLQHLTDNALPQVAMGLGVLLLASSRAPLKQATARVEATGRNCNVLVFDADSYLEVAKTERKGVEGRPASKTGAGEAAAVDLPPERRTFRRSLRDVHTIRCGDSLSAALERS